VRVSRVDSFALYPHHGRRLDDVAEPRAEQGLDLGKVVCRAEHAEVALADDGHVGLHFCVADGAVEFLGDLVELLELLAKGMRLLLDDARLEDVGRGAVLAGGAC
jgi:hypothetical protein